jgi:hypothetical protein
MPEGGYVLLTFNAQILRNSRANQRLRYRREMHMTARPRRLRYDIPNKIAPDPPSVLRSGTDAEPKQDGISWFRTQQWLPARRVRQ